MNQHSGQNSIHNELSIKHHETRELDSGIEGLLNSVTAPPRLLDKLLQLPDIDDDISDAPTHGVQSRHLRTPQRLTAFFQQFRVAIILAVIILIATGFSLLLPGPNS